MGKKGQEGSAGLSNVAFVYQSDSEATLVLLKVVAVLPSETLGSRRGLRAVTKAEGRVRGGLVLQQHTNIHHSPAHSEGRRGERTQETQTGVCCVHVWWTDDETAMHACRSQLVRVVWGWGGMGGKRGHVCTHASG